MLLHRKGLLGLCAFSLLVFLFGPQVSFAQTGTTSLRGTVTDKSGGAIAGAAVTLANPVQSLLRKTETGKNGEYEFLALPPGTYQLTVEKEGFRKFEQKDLQLLVNNPATSDIALEVGAVTQT